MKFLTDENIYKKVVEFLRKLGHEVEDTKELGFFGITDEKLLELAINEKRILITQDVDFADIRFLPRKNPGIIVIRIKPNTGEKIIKALEYLLRRIAPSELKNSLVILVMGIL